MTEPLRRFATTLLSFGFLILGACGGGGGGGDTSQGDSAVAPSITAQPQNISVPAGDTATFTVTATGTAPLSYQWRKNGANVGTNSRTYVTPATTTGDNGTMYDVIVSNPRGNVTSASASLTVGPRELRSVSVSPATASIVQATTQPFTATATYSDNNTQIVTSQATWDSSQQSFATISAGLATGVAAGVTEISAVYGGQTGTAQLTVTATAVAPSITVQPQNITVSAGDTATFTVTATGTSPLSYQWRKYGQNVGNNSATYTTPATTAVDNGATFDVIVNNSQGDVTSTEVSLTVTQIVRIAYLHHSTGGNIWAGGVPEFFAEYNTTNGTNYRITSITYPAATAGYPWANYPYDYWNLWVAHKGANQDHGELNLDQLAASFDVIVFKHCFPVSDIGPDSDSNPPSISSRTQTIANYQLQYNALKTRLTHDFPSKTFIVWTGAALIQAATNPEKAARAWEFFDWVKNDWDEPGDNIFVWDFFALETDTAATGYMNSAYSNARPEDLYDSHPNSAFSTLVAPYLGQRIVDVIEGHGDDRSITGH